MGDLLDAIGSLAEVRAGHERLIRDFYAARARRDWGAARALLADDVVWHESGTEDYSGDHRGADAVVALLHRLVQVNGGHF